MVVMILRKVCMRKITAQTKTQILLQQIRKDYPELSFIESNSFFWDSDKKYISFKSTTINTNQGIWALIHELAHALLDHTKYEYDVELLQLEAKAWEKACSLAKTYALEIDKDYAQDCLDTYRDWLHLRATCPTCFSRSLQSSPRHYYCFNCGSEWLVSLSRHCRPYRSQKILNTA
jgi:hypothetical protein